MEITPKLTPPNFPGFLPYILQLGIFFASQKKFSPAAAGNDIFPIYSKNTEIFFAGYRRQLFFSPHEE